MNINRSMDITGNITMYINRNIHINRNMIIHINITDTIALEKAQTMT